MSWVATSRKPVTDDLSDVKPPAGLTSLSKPERAQYDAAQKAAAQLAQTFDGEVNVAISGDTDTEQVRVVVARA
jgi:hypothetical protein